MYQIHTLKAVRKDLKKLSKDATVKIVNYYLSKLSNNPNLGILLSGRFSNYRKYSFNFKGASYRIIYQISRQEKIILIIAIGSREKFYERLFNRLK